MYSNANRKNGGHVSVDNSRSEFDRQRAQVRTVRKWILVLTSASLAIVLAWGIVVGNSPRESSITTSASAEADAAACDLLAVGLEAVNSGTSLATAMNAVMANGWSNGLPSDPVRGVYNQFRLAVAANRNYLDGVGTFDEATRAFEEAFFAYRSVCQG